MNPDASVVALSFVPETKVDPSRSTTPEGRTRNDHAAEVRRTFEATKATDPYAALHALFLSPEEKSSSSTLDIDKEVGRRISETPPMSGARDLRGEAIIAAKEAQIIAEKGLYGIKNSDGTPNQARQDQIFSDYIVNVLYVREGFAALLTHDEIVAIAIEELSRPEIRTKIAELLNAQLNPDPNGETKTPDDIALDAKNVEKAAKEKEIVDNKSAIAKVNQELQDLQNHFARYQTSPAGIDGDLLQQLNEAQEYLSDNGTKGDVLRKWAKTTYGNNSSQLARDRATVINHMNAGGTFDPTTAQNLAQLQELITFENAQNNFNQLSAERAALPQTIQGKEAEIATLTDAQQALIDAQATIEKQITPLAAKREAREMALVNDLSQLVIRAGNEVILDKERSVIDAYRGILEKKAQATEDADNKRLYNGLASTWEINTGAKDRNGKPIFKPNKARVEQDWQLAITTGDVSTEIEKLLTKSERDIVYNPASTPDEINRAHAEIARIKERLRIDKPFAEKARSEYLTVLIGKRLQTGKKLSPQEQSQMESYGWMSLPSTPTVENPDNATWIKTKTEGPSGQPGQARSMTLSEAQAKFGPDNWGMILPAISSGLPIPAEILEKMAKEKKPRGRIRRIIHL